MVTAVIFNTTLNTSIMFSLTRTFACTTQKSLTSRYNFDCFTQSQFVLLVDLISKYEMCCDTLLISRTRPSFNLNISFFPSAITAIMRANSKSLISTFRTEIDVLILNAGTITSKNNKNCFLIYSIHSVYLYINMSNYMYVKLLCIINN